VERALVGQVELGDVPGLVLAACDVGRQPGGLDDRAVQLEQLLRSSQAVEGAFHRQDEIEHGCGRGELRLFELRLRYALAERNLQQRDELLHEAQAGADRHPLDRGGADVGGENRILEEPRLNQVRLGDPELLVDGLQRAIAQQRDLDGGVERQLPCEQIAHALVRRFVLGRPLAPDDRAARAASPDQLGDGIEPRLRLDRRAARGQAGGQDEKPSEHGRHA
jgi:hypothetical protein